MLHLTCMIIILFDMQDPFRRYQESHSGLGRNHQMVTGRNLCGMVLHISKHYDVLFMNATYICGCFGLMVSAFDLHSEDWWFEPG